MFLILSKSKNRVDIHCQKSTQLKNNFISMRRGRTSLRKNPGQKKFLVVSWSNKYRSSFIIWTNRSGKVGITSSIIVRDLWFFLSFSLLTDESHFQPSYTFSSKSSGNRFFPLKFDLSTSFPNSKMLISSIRTTSLNQQSASRFQ